MDRPLDRYRQTPTTQPKPKKLSQILDTGQAPVLRKSPDLRIALPEGGIGQIPYFFERVDYTYRQHHRWTNQDFGDQPPSEVPRRRSGNCRDIVRTLERDAP